MGQFVWPTVFNGALTDLNTTEQRRVRPQRARLSACMGPPLDQPGSPAPRRDDELNADMLVVELPNHLPVLTPGLARALMRAIASAARAAGPVEVADAEEPEAIAS